MYTSFDIAFRFLNFAKEDGIIVPQMKLLKLTYIAHGYYLGFYGRPLFIDQVQAWKYGPVIPSLYQVTKRFGNHPVDPFIVGIYAKNNISPEDDRFLRLVWNAYKNKTGVELSSLTHMPGSPWSQSYQEGVSDITIDNELIRNYYINLINERATNT
jgi:uncharacterized phage-associated protein